MITVDTNSIAYKVIQAKKLAEEREASLNSMVHDFGDGRVIQVRPSDDQNLSTAIDILIRTGAPTKEWYMADNTFADLTLTELQAAKESGQDQADVIWAAFAAAVKAL